MSCRRHRTSGRVAVALVGVVAALSACSADWVDPDAATSDTIPSGVLAAMPFQNRLDVAQGIFQIKLFNGTDAPLEVVGVRLLWDGLTTPYAARSNRLVAGDRLDFPVPLAAASCTGDGTEATMPDPNDGVVEVSLADGSIVRAEVHDVQGFARTLYLDDCERQHIEAQIGIQLVELHAATFQDRPVTEGTLRLTRRASTSTVTISSINGTVIFGVEAVAELADAGALLAVLPVGVDVTDTQVRFTEGRCDVHAMAEASQPFNFIALLDLGDGVERSIATVPADDDRAPMRRRVEAGCAALGAVGFIGQDA